MAIGDHYLAYEALAQITPPALDSRQGIVLSGRFPNWLLIATTFFYRFHPWVAVYQPQLGPYAVVVHSRHADPAVGTTLWSPAGDGG
ncbi:MAG: CRISPR-associated protein Csx3 [Caldilineaceae bacterium]